MKSYKSYRPSSIPEKKPLHPKLGAAMCALASGCALKYSRTSFFATVLVLSESMSLNTDPANACIFLRVARGHRLPSLCTCPVARKSRQPHVAHHDVEHEKCVRAACVRYRVWIVVAACVARGSFVVWLGEGWVGGRDPVTANGASEEGAARRTSGEGEWARESEGAMRAERVNKREGSASRAEQAEWVE